MMQTSRASTLLLRNVPEQILLLFADEQLVVRTECTCFNNL